jgi:hypothetical protein
MFTVRRQRRRRRKSSRGQSRRRRLGSDSISDSEPPEPPELQALKETWACNDGLVLHALSFLRIDDLLQKKQVSKKWNTLCTAAIDMIFTENSPP